MNWHETADGREELYHAAEKVLPYDLQPYVEDAIQDTLKRYVDSARPKCVPGDTKSNQIAYLLAAVRRAALRLKQKHKKESPGPLPPVIVDKKSDGRIGPPDYSAVNKVSSRLNDEERLLLAAVRLGYTPAQISRILGPGFSKPMISKKRDALGKKAQRLLSGKGPAMKKRADLSDEDVWGFVETGQPALGDDNLRRAIKRALRPLSEAFAALVEEGSHPPIPKGLTEYIQKMVFSRHPSVQEVLEAAAGGTRNRKDLSCEILDAARHLAQPVRWLGIEDAMRIVDDPDLGQQATGWLINLIANSLQLFVQVQQKTDRSLTVVVCDKIKELSDRFAGFRGPFCAPFIPLTVSCVQLSSDANAMDQAATARFAEYKHRLHEVCDETIGNDDAKTTFATLQSLVDFLVRLLEWETFNSPKYLAPAILEEASEVVLAALGPHGQKHSVSEEIGDIIVLLCWLSNVLSVPNLGSEVVAYFGHQGYRHRKKQNSK